MGRPTGERCFAIGSDADELKPLGQDNAVAGLDLVCNKEEERRLDAVIDWINKDGSLAHQVAVLLKNDVAHREHEGMSRDGSSAQTVRRVYRADGRHLS